MNASAPEFAGILIACGAAAAAVVAEDPRRRLRWALLALVAAPILVLGDVWDEPRVVDFRHSPAQIAALLLLGGTALGLLVAFLRRYPKAFAVAAFAVLPLRVPIEVGGETANLLVPLYLVIAAGLVTMLLDPPAARPAPATPWPRRLRLALAATLVLYAIQSAYSEDVANAIENLGFFLVPFAVLFTLLLEVRWDRRLLGGVLVAVVGVAVAVSLIALYQSATRTMFLNPELFDSNELHVYFRVNSIFFDPNILARYLALAITALGAYLAWWQGRRGLLAAAFAAAICLAAISFSYSITGLSALIVGLGMVALLRWGLRGVAIAVGLGLVALVALVVAGGAPSSDIEDYRSIDSGHADLVRGGLDLAEDRPIAGWGSGAFGRAFYDHIERARTTVSHSEPITVAAEQGVIGLAAYLALLVTGLATLFGGAVRSSLARSAVAACFVVLLWDSFGYTGFAIDPAMWALLALGVVLRADRASDPII